MTPKSMKTAVVLGASRKKESYGNKALNRLKDAGYPVIPVNPAYKDIEGIPCAANLKEALERAKPHGIDTLTLYLAPHHLEPLKDDIVRCSPSRVIFNPGTESPWLQQALDDSGIEWKEACTLVLLSTGQY